MNDHHAADAPEAADDSMIAWLSRVVALADPVPPELLGAARMAFGLRELDAQVAELVRDSAVDVPATAVRGLAARLLSFEAGDVSIECEITIRGTHRDIIGQLIGGETATLDVLLADTAEARSVPVGDLGRFTVRDLPPGLVRLRCRLADGSTIVTSWAAL